MAPDEASTLSPSELQRLALLPTEAPVARIDGAISMAREVLGMDVAYLTEFAGEEQIYRAVSGAGSSFDIAAGEGRPLDRGYEERLIAGRIPRAVPSTAENDELRDLALTRSGGIGAYAGVPVRLSNGGLYGTLAAVSHSAKPELGSKQVELLDMLARVVSSGIEQERLQRENDQLKGQVAGLNEELNEAEEDRRLSRIMLSGEFKTLDE